ncbi:hypothetical protein Syncc8109_0876 [Synechococcus sp. WH 8109]|uniref:hypothetical protein n=1 Tax=Synechococcus sp. WH 8109 TaxID=166314 RepID=UPI0001B8DE3C|nr:hypothetical protein [Synechococcus sp. WH 8109]AHF63253.1 hypothetical protein Syncc8109_0876 [Synechococcus sp. WH 8109]
MKVWACLLAGLIAGSTTPGAVARDEHDRGAYNNKMALLGFLLESAQQRAGRDVQTLCLLMSISNDVTERYVATNPGDMQVQQRLMAMRQDLRACLANQAEAHAWADS